ncbi:hypothetical protein TrVE_jg9459 [Triparma verrucosa]|uniref:Uncharacterized protein n=2 Tax=Triparma TaxID=722752 RepID=A0A9W7ANS6_9STRA|nr:hypothetical protein TrST_g8779 [Triparma strigata]GMI04330.1 hypothetical protein TrVE_jg9459 [Triparma verrucosa]
MHNKLTAVVLVNRNECCVLQERLGDDLAYPKRCNNIIIARDHAEGTEGGHKNSTVWPSLARRLTKNKGNSNGLSTHHPSNWLGDVTLDKSQCDQIKAAFKKLNIGMSELPGDCK